MLGLESTSSRMSHLARQEMYRDHTFGLDEMLAAIERVTRTTCCGCADRFFTNGSLAVTVLGQRQRPAGDCEEQLALLNPMIPRYTHPEMGRIWSEQRRYETWLQVEIAAAEAMAAAGIVPAEAATRVCATRARSTSPASTKSKKPRSTT